MHNYILLVVYDDDLEATEVISCHHTQGFAELAADEYLRRRGVRNYSEFAQLVQNEYSATMLWRYIGIDWDLQIHEVAGDADA